MANQREKFGKPQTAIRGTRILAKPLTYFIGQGIPAHTILVFNDQTGTVQSAQVYDKGAGFGLGRNYDPATLVHPIPAKDSPKWADWESKGYKWTTDTFNGCVELLKVEVQPNELEAADR